MNFLPECTKLPCKEVSHLRFAFVVHKIRGKGYTWDKDVLYSDRELGKLRIERLDCVNQVPFAIVGWGVIRVECSKSLTMVWIVSSQ